MIPDVAIVGTGPTGLYTLARLLAAPRPLVVTLFEAQAEAGWGSPYAPGLNDRALLANIASIEIPPLAETLAAWLARQDDAALGRLGVPRARVGEREFYPRLVLGEYFRAQLALLVEAGRRRGFRVDVRPGHRVADVVPQDGDVRLAVEGPDGPAAFAFRHVVIATGHAWPDAPGGNPGYFPSPYPSAALRAIGPVHVGIRGTSLSGIDALVTLATSHGAFLLDAAGALQFHPAPGHEGFRATLMSRKGLLPEADFFFPIPYEPNAVLTEAAVDALVASGRTDLLDATFELFARELALADPDYAASVGLAALDADSFGAAYFAPREGRDPFAWAARNLAEAEANYEKRHTVPWRYAILRAHEVFARVVPHLSPDDLERFNRRLKAVFVDDYATIPHASIERLLALRRAGRLDLLRLGPEHKVDADGPEPGAAVTYEGGEARFPAFVEATGQRALSAPDIPFPSLLSTGLVRKARAGRAPGVWTEEGPPPEVEGIDLDESFRPRSAVALSHEVYCLSLPFLLHQRPFSQGITSAEEIASAAAAAILAAQPAVLEAAV